jgi:AcrR family transcriptional regulator
MLPNQIKLDPRTRRTRQLLQAAFLGLLQEKGFQAMTVQDIAERATVNRATFYAHFEDKYELLEYCIREGFKEIVSARLPADATLSAGNLERLILAICEFVSPLGDHCPPSQHQFHSLVEAQIRAEIYETLLIWLKDAQARGQAIAATPELAATVTSWAIYGAVQQWSQGDRRQPAEHLARQVLPLIEASLYGHTHV